MAAPAENSWLDKSVLDSPRPSSVDTVIPSSNISTATLAEEKPDTDNAFKPGSRFYLAFGALMLMALMIALDGTSISVALTVITQKLSGTAIQAFWTGTGFMLACAVVQPLVASLSHIFGRRPMLFASMAFFLAGSIMSALANDFNILIIGRAIQGIGGGGIIALLEILITDLVPLRKRGDWMGLLSAMWALGSVTGPVIGGAFAQSVSWRWIFYINIPFIGIGGPLVWFFLQMAFKESGLWEKLRRVDWIGMVLFVGSAISFLVPMTWGGILYSWESWHTLVPLLVGIVGLVAFYIWEAYFAKEQLIRLSIFSSRTAKIAYFTTTMHGFILWCMLYYIPLFFEACKGYSPILSGIAIFPGTFATAPVAAITGVLISKTGRYRWFIIIGWAIATLGCGVFYILDVDTPTPGWVFILFIFGTGLGTLFTSQTFAVQGASEEKDMAFAVAMFAFFRNLGQALGVAIGGVVFQNQILTKLKSYPHFASTAAELAKDATGLVQVIKDMEHGQDRDDLKQVFADSCRSIWVLLACLAGLCLILSWFIKEYDLNRALETEQAFQHKKTKSEDEVSVEEGQKI